MYKDLGKFTIHVNRYHTHNWAIGIDYYSMFDALMYRKEGSVLMVNLLFFNVTITKWA